jgi:hypothetical protein
MARMPSRVGLRSASLLALGALAVHDGRFALSYGHASGRVMAEQGHAYLTWVGPLAVAAVVLAALRFVTRLARPEAGAVPVPRRRLRLWLTVAALLVAVYTVQEWSEGLLAAGHPGGLLEPFAHGGLVVFPLAAAAAAIITLLLWGADAALARAAAPAVVFSRVRGLAPRAPRDVHRARRPALALHGAGRAPPLPAA